LRIVSAASLAETFSVFSLRGAMAPADAFTMTQGVFLEGIKVAGDVLKDVLRDVRRMDAAWCP
jgi:hypothetical protein